MNVILNYYDQFSTAVCEKSNQAFGAVFTFRYRPTIITIINIIIIIIIIILKTVASYLGYVNWLHHFF